MHSFIHSFIVVKFTCTVYIHTFCYYIDTSLNHTYIHTYIHTYMFLNNTHLSPAGQARAGVGPGQGRQDG